jgi:choline-glycine betaine transporter
VIRLRRGIDHALATRWLRILVICLLVGLLALVFLHVTADGIHHEEDALVCVAFVLLLSVLLVSRAPASTIARLVPPSRGPPLRTSTAAPALSLSAVQVVPLRR